MNEHILSFDEQSLRQLQPIAVIMGMLSAAVLIAAILLAQFLQGVRSPVLYAYGLLGCASAIGLWRARTMGQLWTGGTGAMVASAVGYSSLVRTFSNPDLWFFSTGLSLTLAVIVTFHVVWHYLLSTSLVWVVMACVGLPNFTNSFDYALGLLVVTASIGTGAFLVFILRQTRFAAYSMQQRLHRIAHRDALTGIPNRRAFMDGLQAQTQQGADGLHLLMIDIDDFKSVNDQLGHDAGDQALIAISQALAREARSLNHGRLGGEEFAVAGHLTDDEAHALADAVVRQCNALVIEGRRLSVSVGLASLWPGDTPAGLLRRADTALYLAKSAGKNQYRSMQ